MKYSQDDATLVFIESKGFDTKTAEGLQKALKWVQTISTPPATFLIAFGWSIDSPCVSRMNCSRVIFLTSCSLRGQENFPSSRRLYSSRKPSPSYPNIRIRGLIRRFLLSEHLLEIRRVPAV